MRTKESRNAMMFVLFVLFSVVLALFFSKMSYDNMQKVEKTTSVKNLDSIISQKVDYRLTSYDNRFIYSNTVVIDSTGDIIGRIILYTNDNEIDSFYSNDKFFKTKTYQNLKDGSLIRLEK